MTKNWLIGSLIACVLFGCSTKDKTIEHSTITPESTKETTASPRPISTPPSTFDPYNVYLRHSPLETMNFLKHLDENVYYSVGEDPGKNFLLIGIYDFDNWISETRLYIFEDKEKFSPEALNSNDYVVTNRYNYLLSTVDTYQDDYTHTASATCHLDYKNSSYYPESKECALEYEYNEDFKINMIMNSVLSYALGDTFEDVLTLSDALRNDTELQDEYIKAIFEYFNKE